MISSLESLRFVAFDFDGVFTDNRVWVFEDGREAVACLRSDGYGLEMLRRVGVDTAIFSSETNPVVAARAKKLNIPCFTGLTDKRAVLEDVLAERGILLSETAYVGNDMNDLECLRAVAVAVAVGDAYPQIKKAANLVLRAGGGQGAVREFCEKVFAAKNTVWDGIGDERSV